MEKINSKPSDEEPEDSLEINNPEEPVEGELHRRRHKRIKVRRRIRIKKRTSPKKKAKRTMETVAWVVIIAAFLICLIILILQLDLNDKRTKKAIGTPLSMVYGLQLPHISKL